MKKISILLIAIALISLGLYGTSYAFHDGGVARCEGCHTMHNSLNGTAMRTLGGLTQYNAGPYLLQGPDATSACLNCHGTGDTTSSYHVSTESVTAGGATIPNQYTPGGDFSWIKYTVNSVGSNRGHNVISGSYSFVQDARLAAAPGGTFPASALGCSACHDPHSATRVATTGFVTRTMGVAVDPIEESGSYGAEPVAGLAVGTYRFLGGAGYAPKGAAITFSNNPPIAVAPSTYNRTEGTGAGQTRVAYGAGMSEWCANCHAGIHNNAYPSVRRHPASNSSVLGAQAGIYNAYVSSGDLSGTSATSFNSLVPFEMQETTIANLAAVASYGSTVNLNGPDNVNDNVMCLSCHRAHASGFASMLRFDMADALITDGTPAFEARAGMTDAALTAAYYGRDAAYFGPAQRVLCNKCHAKD